MMWWANKQASATFTSPTAHCIPPEVTFTSRAPPNTSTIKPRVTRRPAPVLSSMYFHCAAPYCSPFGQRWTNFISQEPHNISRPTALVVSTITDEKRPRETQLTLDSAQAAPFATVFVGSTKVPLFVHQDLLTYHSTFFAAALNGNFREADDRAVTSAESDPWTFEMFVHWLYHQALPASKTLHPNS